MTFYEKIRTRISFTISIVLMILYYGKFRLYMMDKVPLKKAAAIFGAGLIEQILYTLYLLAVSRYMIIPSTILMMTYMIIYLLIINYAIKDEKNSLPLLIVYALSSGVGNWIAMTLHIIR